MCSNRVLSPTKPVAVFFKFVAPSAGTDGAIATRGSNNYHVCAYEASGTYGAFLGAYPSHVDQLVYGAYGTGVTFPEANASALMADLGISTGLTDYFDRLGARMDFGSAVSLLDDTGMPVAVPYPKPFCANSFSKQQQCVSPNVNCAGSTSVQTLLHRALRQTWTCSSHTTRSRSELCPRIPLSLHRRFQSH